MTLVNSDENDIENSSRDCFDRREKGSAGTGWSNRILLWKLKYSICYLRDVEIGRYLLRSIHNETGLEVIERLRFLASLPLAGTRQREGDGVRVAIPHFKSQPVEILPFPDYSTVGPPCTQMELFLMN